jgi:hypothetical protein
MKIPYFSIKVKYKTGVYSIQKYYGAPLDDVSHKPFVSALCGHPSQSGLNLMLRFDLFLFNEFLESFQEALS